MSFSPSPPPSILAIVLSTGILGLVTGYFLGQGASLGLFSSSAAAGAANSSKPKSWPNSYDVVVHPDTSDEELMEHLRGKGGVKNPAAAATTTATASHDSDGESNNSEEEEEDNDEGEGVKEGVIGAANVGLKAFEDSTEEFKLVLVVRTDLGMQKGRT
jgi:peptidyl-tRNA hydrolase, PTH2 family